MKVLHYLWDYTGISDKMHFEMHRDAAIEAFHFLQANGTFESVSIMKILEYNGILILGL